VSWQDNAIDETLNSLNEVIGVRSSCVSPVKVIALLLLSGSNVYTAKFGVHDRCTGLVRGSLVDTGDGLKEDATTASFRSDDAFEGGAGLFDLRAIGVVVESGKIGENVLPATVVVDTSGIVEVPRVPLMGGFLI